MITSRGDKCGSHFIPARWAEKMVLRFIMNRNQDRDQESRSAQRWVIRQKSSHRGSKEDERPTTVTDAVSSCLIWNLKQWQVFDLPPKTLSQDSPSLTLKRPKLLTLWYHLSKALSSSTQKPSGPKWARSITSSLQVWSSAREFKFPVIWEKLVF